MSVDNMKTTELEPQVGMGVTVVSWTERHPYTIISVYESGKSKTKTLDIQEDKVSLSNAKEYEFESDPEGNILKVTFRKDGKWRVKGDQKVVLIGVREKGSF